MHMIYKKFTSKINVLILLSVISIFSYSCKKFLEIESPKNEIISREAFNNDETAKAILDGIYGRMMSSYGFASGQLYGTTFLCGLSSDELMLFSGEPQLQEFFDNGILPQNSSLEVYIWAEPYQYIYSCNLILEGVVQSASLSEKTKRQLQGEALFVRAFCHFYLMQLFGNVPLVLSTDYQVNNKEKRRSQSEIYSQIIDDLKEAKTLLLDDFSSGNGERTRPNKPAASALLARVYLYNRMWREAEAEATVVIDNNNYSLLQDLDEVFIKNNDECIWALAPVIPGFNTNEASNFIFDASPNYVHLRQNFIDSFSEVDKRKTYWISSTSPAQTYYYPYKYKIRSGMAVNEYSIVLRLAEQYLIRAEARIQQDKFADAVLDIDTIRTRAGLPSYQELEPVLSKDNLLLEIENQRYFELFTEWGHRWLDLKRTGRANAVLSSLKSDWQATDTLYPIPQKEIEKNPNLKPQNDGY